MNVLGNNKTEILAEGIELIKSRIQFESLYIEKFISAKLS
jgi:hypothetical protein